MPLLDRLMADRIDSWQCWWRRRVIDAVDAAVRDIDPEAAKELRVTADTAHSISIVAQPNGMAQLRGSLPAPAAAVFDKRLSELATAVCPGDPHVHGITADWRPPPPPPPTPPGDEPPF